MATNNSASTLHKGVGMKSLAFTFLAAVAMSACGVGADEYYDGQNLVTQDQELTQRGPDVTAQNTSANATPKRDPGTVALPQDPIPLYEGKPVIPSPIMPFQVELPGQSAIRPPVPMPLR